MHWNGWNLECHKSTHEYDRLARNMISVLFRILYKHISWFDGDLGVFSGQAPGENVLDIVDIVSSELLQIERRRYYMNCEERKSI